YLREQGVYSSQITEWRKLRDAGLVAGRKPGEKIGRPSADQAEIARLTRELDTTRRRLAKTEAALALVGKAHALLEEFSERGGHRGQAAATLTGCYDDLVSAGIRTRDAAVLLGLSKATQDRRRRTNVPAPADPVARPAPVNKLTDGEAAELIAVLNSRRFVDKAPPQIYATLLAEGTYLCSISTMYRTLERNRQVKDRRRQATHPPRAVPELQATAPRQVYSWDITKLAGPVKGQYFDCYVMIDIYSRYIVGAHVHNTETALLAVDLMTEVFGVQGVPHVVHADRGTSMTSKPVAALLDDLGVTRSHSRPRVSNDNPFSEAWNKTLKYAPVFPERFTSLQAARQFVYEFVEYYNHEHRHGGVGLHTPADVHYGLARETARHRSQTLEAARRRHPTRFATTHDPKILDLPTAAWINEPQNQDPAA
ncbi:MAG: IS3 family transposase, partial [Nakamurella sp.]